MRVHRLFGYFYVISWLFDFVCKLFSSIWLFLFDLLLLEVRWIISPFSYQWPEHKNLMKFFSKVNEFATNCQCNSILTNLFHKLANCMLIGGVCIATAWLLMLWARVVFPDIVYWPTLNRKVWKLFNDFRSVNLHSHDFCFYGNSMKILSSRLARHRWSFRKTFKISNRFAQNICLHQKPVLKQNTRENPKSLWSILSILATGVSWWHTLSWYDRPTTYNSGKQRKKERKQKFIIFMQK